MRRAHRSLTALTGVLFIATLAAPRAGSATSDEIALSVDGVGYSAQLTEPLFDPALVWAPGDARSARFWVRNRSDEAAVLAIDVTSTDSGGLLATGAIVIGGRAGGAPMRPVRAAGTHRLVSGVPVAGGGTVAVDLTIGLAADAPDSAQSRGFTFEVAATLTSDDVPVDTPEGMPATTTTAAGPPATATTSTATTSTTSPNGAQPPGPATTVRPLAPTTDGRSARLVPAAGAAGVPALLAAAGFLVMLGVLAGRAARTGRVGA